MHTTRSRAGVASGSGGKLYCIGGFDGVSRLSTVECYDPVTDEWSAMSPMMTKRSALAVATVGEELYVIGGYDGAASLSSVEMYVLGDVVHVYPLPHHLPTHTCCP